LISRCWCCGWRRSGLPRPRDQPRVRRRQDRRDRPVVREPWHAPGMASRLDGQPHEVGAGAAPAGPADTGGGRRRRRRDVRRVDHQPRDEGFFIFRPGEGYEYVMTLTLLGLAISILGPGTGASTTSPNSNPTSSVDRPVDRTRRRRRRALALLAGFWRPNARRTDAGPGAADLLTRLMADTLPAVRWLDDRSGDGSGSGASSSCVARGRCRVCSGPRSERSGHPTGPPRARCLGSQGADYVIDLAERLVGQGLAAAAIDGPVHGDRRLDGGENAQLAFLEFCQAWSSDPSMTDEMVGDWSGSSTGWSAR